MVFDSPGQSQLTSTEVDARMRWGRLCFRSGFFWTEFSEWRSATAQVKNELAQRHRLNQSAAARCVTGRSHGYLAATATAVNMSCQTVTYENKRTEKKNRTDWQTGAAVNLTATRVQTALGWRPRSVRDSGPVSRGTSGLQPPVGYLLELQQLAACITPIDVLACCRLNSSNTSHLSASVSETVPAEPAGAAFTGDDA